MLDTEAGEEGRPTFRFVSSSQNFSLFEHLNDVNQLGLESLSSQSNGPSVIFLLTDL